MVPGLGEGEGRPFRCSSEIFERLSSGLFEARSVSKPPWVTVWALWIESSQVHAKSGMVFALLHNPGFMQNPWLYIHV